MGVNRMSLQQLSRTRWRIAAVLEKAASDGYDAKSAG